MFFIFGWLVAALLYARAVPSVGTFYKRRCLWCLRVFKRIATLTRGIAHGIELFRFWDAEPLRRLQHHAAAIRRTTRAAPPRVLRWRVIKRDLLAGLDVAQREEQHVSARDSAEAVRRAGVIDERRRIASAACVDAPAVVQLADADLAAFRHAPRGFAIADPLTEELADLFTALERRRGETASAVDP